MKNRLKSKRSIVDRQWSIDYRLWAIILLMVFSCTQKKDQASHDLYTCPMHPTVIQDKPGSCPVCGMDLVKKGQPGEEVKITAELNYLLKPTNAMVASSIKTISPVQKSMNVQTKSNGIITYDTRRFTSLPIRFGGRIEKLLVKYNFQPIRKGQKILEIYSPELLTAQRDLLYLLKSDKDNSQLIEGAKEKLRLLGLSDSQISELSTTSQENYSFAIHSPVNGYIVEEAVVNSLTPTDPAASVSMDGGMATSNSTTKQAPTRLLGGEILIREGMYVSTGQIIFKIVNTEQVWVEFDVYQRDAAFISENDQVHLTFDNTPEEIVANVNFIQPFFKNGERFVKVRVYLSNQGNKFRIGQLVKAQFSTPSQNTLWIPVSARLDLGTKEIAFTKRRGVFRPKEIITSRQSGDWIEVISGLEVSDSIAYRAQFMIDSESFIKVRN